ncbi:MAG: tRNA (5-methylaminomethyl-2-thiouridine)(34)-methyltransferase MnmD [Daejeonella sp.]
MNNLIIVPTSDGSNTIYNPQIGENYHSRHGALQESIHVFLNFGLRYFLENKQANNVSILEVGFGTGLNFLLSANLCSTQNIQLKYTGIEAYPLDNDLINQTLYNTYIAEELWSGFITAYPLSFNKYVEINSNCKLKIAHTKLLDYQTSEQFDIIYFDAFASVHQPEMWDEEALKHVCSFLKTGGVFVTYAITGHLKRTMKALGFAVEKIQGAKGKREMFRGTKLTSGLPVL